VSGKVPGNIGRIKGYFEDAYRLTLEPCLVNAKKGKVRFAGMWRSCSGRFDHDGSS